MGDNQDWMCPKPGCELGAEGHNLALAIEHIYGGVETTSGHNFDASESQEVADKVLDQLADDFGIARNPNPESETDG